MCRSRRSSQGRRSCSYVMRALRRCEQRKLSAQNVLHAKHVNVRRRRNGVPSGLAWSQRGRPKSDEPRSVQLETSVTAAEKATLAAAAEATGRPVADLLRAGGLAEAGRILTARAAE